MVLNAQKTYFFKRLRALLACAAIFLLLFGCATPAKISSPQDTIVPEYSVVAATEAPTPTPAPTPEPTPDPATLPATLVWISDTQGYSSSFPHIFLEMTQWIVDYKTDLNI